MAIGLLQAIWAHPGHLVKTIAAQSNKKIMTGKVRV
jgi:hypothetical protein